MAQVRIRQAVAKAPWPHWQLLKFTGAEGRESRGVVDLLAIRKDHGEPYEGTKRGDCFQIILIQVKGGRAARPTAQDALRLRAVARRHHARKILLATWKKGSAACFFRLPMEGDWLEVSDLAEVFQ